MIFHPMTFTEVEGDLVDAIDVDDYKGVTRCSSGIDAGVTQGMAQLYPQIDLL